MSTIQEFKLSSWQDPIDANKDLVTVTINTSEAPQRRPLALISVIDVSGSMSIDATSNTGTEEAILTRLQLVQHSIKTIIASLEADDQIALISFDSRAQLDFDLKPMSDANRRDAVQTVDGFRPRDSTNIWLGMQMAIKMTQNIPPNYNTAIMLFTDGEPTDGPYEGTDVAIEVMLRKVRKNFTMSTFGYGYSIDTELLTNICTMGNGIYGYCPDCSMVGTIFINYLAAMMSTIAPYTKLTVDGQTQQIDLRKGNKRHISFVCPKGAHKATIAFDDQQVDAHFTDADEEMKTDADCRRLFLAHLDDLISNPDPNKTKALFARFAKMPQTAFVKAVCLDMCDADPNHGQVEKAVTADAFERWGRNYLAELAIFHKNAICGNFKDQSLQGYAFPAFEEIVNTANEIFLSLTPPVGKKKQAGGYTYTANYRMNDYYDAYGGCFDGDAMVSNPSGRKPVKSLIKGDRLVGGGIVECVVKSKCSGLQKAVVLSGVKFTPYHPIRSNGAWVFPATIGKVEDISIDYWYNLVLSGSSEVTLNGVKAITLGHGRTEDILQHPYFGTQLVIDGLKKHQGYLKGFLSLEEPQIVRDPISRLITQYY